MSNNPTRRIGVTLDDDAQPCPAWCVEHVRLDDDRTHPADRGVYHFGQAVTWSPTRGGDTIKVRIEGFRHDGGAHLDWADDVRGSGNLDDGSMSGFALSLPDAGRLSIALSTVLAGLHTERVDVAYG